jgi:hypothetical protein
MTSKGPNVRAKTTGKGNSLIRLCCRASSKSEVTRSSFGYSESSVEKMLGRSVWKMGANVGNQEKYPSSRS